jgi:hypothetical protein
MRNMLILIAFNHYTELWNLIIDMEPDQFEYFNGSVRIPLLVLQAHFLAFEIVLRPFLQASGAFVNGDSKLCSSFLGKIRTLMRSYLCN